MLFPTLSRLQQSAAQSELLTDGWSRYNSQQWHNQPVSHSIYKSYGNYATDCKMNKTKYLTLGNQLMSTVYSLRLQIHTKPNNYCFKWNYCVWHERGVDWAEELPSVMRFPSSYLPVGRPVPLVCAVQVGRPVQVGEPLVNCLSSFGYLCFIFPLCGYVPLHLSFCCILMYSLLHYNSIPYNVRYITLFSKIFLYYWNANTII